MKLRALLSSLAFLAAAAPAAAQNYEGSGLLQFGVFLQGTIINTDVNTTTSGPPVVVDEGSADMSGFGGGVSFGYDHRFGHMILGIVADLAIDGASKTYDGVDYGTNFMATLRGRIGGNVRPDTLLYFTTGLSLLNLEAEYLSGGANRKIHDTLAGWVIGGGIERKWHHVTLFGEYLYASYDKWNFTGVVGPVVNTYRVDADSHAIRFGIKFNIGHDHYHDTVRGGPYK